MPNIFYRKAIEAAVHPASAAWLRDKDFEDWTSLAVILDKLTLEQRCDAVYADWLLQLHSPAHQALLQIRNLLIGQGALAANYLAELAQNADDAADGKEAEVRIVLDGDWLFVANNGRKVTSMNLLGLCRFFIHSAGQVRELNEETIGRFGIGFKSSYRIASEVIVQTWDADGSFVFRIPICREEGPASCPDADRLEHLLGCLNAVGVENVKNSFRDTGSLGYCTPEFLLTLPATLSERTSEIRQSKRGTLFCFHIRPDQREEVKRRISGQAHEVYELCPLFLPNVRFVQLGPNQLSMQVGRHDPANDLPGIAVADRVTLTTSAPDQPQSHSRFWRLREPSENPTWQVALHADSQHRLRVDHEDDEHGVTLKDGAAYAFFPLNSVNWPFRFHLHLKLPTNLPRDNWNPADAPAVENRLRRAVQSMADWLDRHFDSLAASGWSLEKLVEQRPSPMRNEGDWSVRWANIVFEELSNAAQNKPLLRTFGGRRVQATLAHRVQVIERQAAAEAWSKLSATPGLKDAFPAFVSQAAEVFDVEAAIPDEVGDVFAGILANAQLASEVRQAAMLAYLSTTKHSGGSLERALKSAAVELADHSFVLAGELMTEPCGTELEPAWHECFKRLSDWARDADWQSNHVFGQRIDEQFRKLSQAVFNPPWSQLSARLGNVEAWQEHGEQFWNCSRRPCPPELRGSALVCLRLPSGDGGWLPLSGLWLDDDTPVNCFAGLLTAWPLRHTDTERKRITGLLKEWGLFEEWERRTEKELSEKLSGELTRRLTEQSTGDAFALVFNKAFEDAHRLLDRFWSQIVNEAEKTAAGRFVHARANEEKLSGKTALSASITTQIRAALCLDDRFVPAPSWLTDAAYQRICRLGLQEKLKFEFQTKEGLRMHGSEYGRRILDTFHGWRNVLPTTEILEGLHELFSAEGIQDRRNLSVGLSTQRQRPLRELFAGVSTLPADAKPFTRLMSTRLIRAKQNVEPLPPPLDQVPALVEASVHLGRLRCERDEGNEVLLDSAQVAEIANADADVQALIKEGVALYGAARGLCLRWYAGEHLVAELPDADVGWFGDRLVFGRFARPASEAQYDRLLALYELSDVESEDYKKAKRQRATAFDLYSGERDHIVEVLVKKHVKEVGYTREHVLRELLQNAESAYASKTGSPINSWFEFRVEPGSRSNERVVRVRHAGRAFNERDRDGKERPDIERIIKINAPNQNTEQELGRFNRGFKSVFTVAKDGKVRVRSGRYRFEIQDLLLLNPAEPKEDQPAQAETEFEFVASQADSLGLLTCTSAPTSKTPPGVLNATSLLFLAYLRRVKICWDDKHWEWRMMGQALSHAWVRVEVQESTSSKSEAFLVHSGKLEDSRRFGVAIRLGANGEPKVLEKDWRTLRLTFETQFSFGLDVLVNGDFEADQGRVNLHEMSTTGADIIEASLNATLVRAKSELAEHFSKEKWVAWAKVLHLKDAHEVFETVFQDIPKRFARWIGQVEEILSALVPCRLGSLALNDAGFPTRLMRRLAKDFGQRWGIRDDNWIEHEAEEELPHQVRDDQTKTRFPNWISEHQRMARILFVIRDDLAQPSFEALKRSLTKPERDELSESERILGEMLLPVQQEEEPDEAIELPVIEKWSVEKLCHWWEQQGKPTNDYTLEGDQNWRLFYADDPGSTQLRSQRLKLDLLATTSDSGKRIWYRLFSLACLMSAGRRMAELREFWHGELEGRQFWVSTSGTTFGQGTDALFDDLMQRRFANLLASGEHAYFWRRVFYDIRKIHKLVWEDGFADTLLRLVQSRHSGELLNFLKTGALSGQDRWVGVFGQSAGAPLFFLVRELCRLRVITDSQIQPLAFFVSTPVRRAMARIGWLVTDTSEIPDFEFLSSLSSQLHTKISTSPEFGPKLLPYYDIPLLHLGLNG